MTPFIFRSITTLTVVTVATLIAVYWASPVDNTLDMPLTAPSTAYGAPPTAEDLYAERLAQALAEVRAERQRNWGWLAELLPYTF